MPQRSVPYTIVNANTLEIFSTPVNDQTLEAVTLTLTEDATEPNVAYGTIGILSGGTTIAHKLITLDEGWLDRSNDLCWTGVMHLPKNAHLFARVISDTTRSFRLNAILWDFEPPKLREAPSG